VLFVEDDQPVAAITARVLRLAGLDVVVAPTLAAARAALAASEFDAILSDVELSDGNALDLLRDLRGANSVTPVVLISGSPSVDVAATAMGLRASNYVQKPVHPDELVNLVTEAIGEGRLARLAALGEGARPIFVNLHPSEFRRDVLAAPGDPLRPLAHRVVLEVTERAALARGATLDDALRAARTCGYRLAVDDLGEGYAGLATLAALEPDFAKIDMSLVRGVDRAPLKRDIIAALVHLASKTGITVVAEGVETAEERAVLTTLGVDLLQGYFVGRPGPIP
jgi:EAL domain-containing protein (putative c-di-GMP-specific phosphodiesterase class I)